MGFFLHVVKNFPLDKLYEAVQKQLKVDDDIFDIALPSIKKFNEPAIKKVLIEFRNNPSFKMEAFHEGAGMFVRVLDDHGKLVKDTETTLIKNPLTLVKASQDLLAEKKAKHAAATRAVAARQIKPITVILKDFAGDVMKKAGEHGKFEIKDLKIEITLKDPIILQNVPNEVNDAALAHKLHAAANPDEICLELTAAYINASNRIQAPKDLTAAEAEFKKQTQFVVENATKRASKPITDLLKISIDHKRFQTELGVSLGVAIIGTVVGTAATTVSILTAPLHAGVATFASVAATVQSFKATVDLVMQSSRTLEGTCEQLGDDLKELQGQYEDLSKNAVGTNEVLKTVYNSFVLPNVANTINHAKTLLEQVEGGLKGREIEIHRMASQLNAMLDKAQKGDNQIAEFEAKNKNSLNPKQEQILRRAKQAADGFSVHIQQMLEGVTSSFESLTELNSSYHKMAQAVAKLASSKPTWAELGEVLITTGAAAGFMIGGNISGGPNPFRGLERLNTLATVAGNAQGSIDLTLNLSKELEDLVAH